MSIVGKYTFASDDGKVEAFFNAMGTPAEMMPVALAMSKAEIEITGSGDQFTMGNEAKKVTFTLGKEFDESYGDRTAKITINKTADDTLERVTVTGGKTATTKMAFSAAGLTITQSAEGVTAVRNYNRA